MRLLSAVIFGLLIALVGAGLTTKSARAAEDNREMVELPPMMQEHMLANMRDHLVALNEVLGELADGNIDEAVAISERRLGMSSMSLHGAEHLGKFMPKAMGAIGTEMHHAASRFGIVARDAELDPGLDSQRKIYKALQEITDNCTACHQAYRIR